MLEHKIYCWWLNNEDMSQNRHVSLNDLRNKFGSLFLIN